MAVPVRAGQAKIKTECGRCHAKFSDPTRANRHLQKQHIRSLQGGKMGVNQS